MSRNRHEEVPNSFRTNLDTWRPGSAASSGSADRTQRDTSPAPKEAALLSVNHYDSLLNPIIVTGSEPLWLIREGHHAGHLYDLRAVLFRCLSVTAEVLISGSGSVLIYGQDALDRPAYRLGNPITQSCTLRLPLASFMRATGFVTGGAVSLKLIF